MDTIKANGLETFTALLRADAKNKTASAYLAALQSGGPVSREGLTGPVPLANIQTIYRRRAEWNAEREGGIAGFPELLAGLEQLSGSTVCIHSLGFTNARFLAFTNSDSTQLAGVLQIPEPLETPAIRQHATLAAAQK